MNNGKMGTTEKWEQRKKNFSLRTPKFQDERKQRKWDEPKDKSRVEKKYDWKNEKKEKKFVNRTDNPNIKTFATQTEGISQYELNPK